MKHGLNCQYRDQIKQNHNDCSCDCHKPFQSLDVIVEPDTRYGFFAKLMYWSMFGLGLSLFSLNYNTLNLANISGVTMMVFGLLFGILSIHGVRKHIQEEENPYL